MATALLCLATASQVGAQSITMAAVNGALRSDTGRPVGTALITITPIGSGSRYETASGPLGLFDFGLIRPGSYEVRVEALGYRPLVARILTVSGGDRRALEFTLRTEPPPVVSIDTVSLGTAAVARWRAGGMQFGGWEIDELPHRFDDLASVTSLSTEFDEGLGAQGLPGDMTVVVADGLPFYRAAHPLARSEHLPNALFPTSALSSVAPNHVPSDIERTGGASGYVNVETRSSEVGDGLGIRGSISGPGWSSSQLDLDETPTLIGYQAAINGGIAIDPGTSQITLSGEALRRQTPLAPRVGAELADELAGIDPNVVNRLETPGVETYERYSGLARYDTRQGNSSQFFIRGAGALARRTYAGFGPITMAGTAAIPQESVEFSIAGAFINRPNTRTQVEVRAGFSGSSRDFAEAIPGLGPAYLVDRGAALGDVPSSFGEASRFDIVAVPTVRYQLGLAEAVKFGFMVRFADHTMRHAEYSLDDLVFANPGRLVDADGYGRYTNALEASFSTREYGAFAQYERTLESGFTLAAGIRYDYESLPRERPAVNQLWRDATGIDNSAYDDSYHQFGGTGSITFDPGRDGDTRVFLAGGLQYGDVDPRALYELNATAAEARLSVYDGSELAWPFLGVPSSTPAVAQVAAFGPDLRPPRSIQANGGVMQRLGPKLALFARASFRRTDFLMRRRNLNLLRDGSTFDPHGREVLGQLNKDGGRVTTNGIDARLLALFGDAWALDPDGWSKYLGFTAGLEHTSSVVTAYAAYTYSETTDNWIGARSGTVGGTLPPGVRLVSGEPWGEGTSDFDLPHRISGGVSARLGPVLLGGAYRYRSGLPFTPRYRLGVDANGDGSIRNDVAFVPSAAELGTLLGEWSCLEEQLGSFATRNSCRGPAQHSLDVRFEFTLGDLAGFSTSIMLDLFNVVETESGLIDDALLLVDPDLDIVGSPDGSVVTIPTNVNPGFGQILYPTSPGRLLRLGVRLGG